MIAVSVTNDRQQAEFTHQSGPLVLGRAQEGESPRVVVTDGYVSRDQMRLEPLSDGRVRITNLGGPLCVASTPPQAVDLEETVTPEPRELARGETVELVLPVRLTAGYTVFQLKSKVEPPSPPAAVASMQTLARPVMARDLEESSLAELGETPTPERLAEWFERLLRVQRAAAGSDAFYQETARAVVDLIGLDRGLVMLRRGERWDVQARFARRESEGPQFSRKVLQQVVSEQRTFFEGLQQQDRMHSLAKVEAVVAAPILDEQGEVIGAVYGCREVASPSGQRGITPLEAQLTQLLAGAVSTGLARMQREAEAIRARVQFEQFFSHDLAEALERNPQMLEGQQREVTALFVDVRSFSRISETLGPAQTYHLLHDVMDMLTDHVMSRGGVVIDYHGDGLAAMWNAPIDREHHAQEACDAALGMHDSLPRLNERWESVLGFPLRIGTGLNTGMAQVGNAGSSRRMKYGPMGHTVNLASRIEGATKPFGVSVLVSEATRSQFQRPLPTRRLCRVRAVGVQGDVAIHEVRNAATDHWLELCQRYHDSLELFEAGKLQEALSGFQSLQADFPDDRASEILRKVVASQMEGETSVEPIIELSSK